MPVSHYILAPEMGYRPPAQSPGILRKPSDLNSYVTAFTSGGSQAWNWVTPIPFWAAAVNCVGTLLYRIPVSVPGSGVIRWTYNIESLTDNGNYSNSETSISTDISVAAGAASGIIYSVQLTEGALPDTNNRSVVHYLQRGSPINNYPGDVEVLGIYWPFVTDILYNKGGICFPAQCMDLPFIPQIENNSYYDFKTHTTQTMYAVITTPGTGDSYADVKFRLPDNYWGGLGCMLSFNRPADLNTVVTYEIYGTVVPASGTAIVPTFVLLASSSSSGVSLERHYCKNIYLGWTAMNAVAGDEIILRIKRPANDQSILISNIMALLVYWDTKPRVPATVEVSPTMFTVPQAGGATLEYSEDNNKGLHPLLTFSGSGNPYAIYRTLNPGAVYDQFTVKYIWQSSSAETTGFQIRTSFSKDGVGDVLSDSFNAGPTRSMTSAGAGKRNTHTETYFASDFTPSQIGMYNIKTEKVGSGPDFSIIEMHIQYRATDTGN